MEMKNKEITWKSFFYYAVPTMISAMFLAWILPIKNDWIQCIPLILSYICLEISCFRSDKKLGIVAILLLLISYFLFTKEDIRLIGGLIFCLFMTGLLSMIVATTMTLQKNIFFIFGIIGAILIIIKQETWIVITGVFLVSLMNYRYQFEEYQNHNSKTMWSLVYYCLFWTVFTNCWILWILV